MHDIDRTQLEMENDEFEFESNVYEADQEFDNEFEFESPFNEADEMDLAAELLSVSNEDELDQFLGKLIRRAGRAIGKVVKSPLGKKLGGLLRSAAKKALPIAAGAVGGFFGGPAGAAIGSKLGGAAGQIFGLELEGLSAEDQEFEVARQFVRFAGSAVRNATNEPADGMESEVAQGAVVAAAQKHAPGLLKPLPRVPAGIMQHGNSGRWIRRGQKIVLLGV
jgi:uncharacterized protein (DUF697 family)